MDDNYKNAFSDKPNIDLKGIDKNIGIELDKFVDGNFFLNNFQFLEFFFFVDPKITLCPNLIIALA